MYVCNMYVLSIYIHMYVMHMCIYVCRYVGKQVFSYIYSIVTRGLASKSRDMKLSQRY